jgi:hypothetical protein
LWWATAEIVIAAVLVTSIVELAMVRQSTY